MRLSIFCSLEDNWSIRRYADELSAAFPASVDTETISFPLRPGLTGKIFDKHLLYLPRARKRQGDWNLVVSEGYGFLLLALDPTRTVCICHDLHPIIYPGRDFGYRRRFWMNLWFMRKAHRVVAVSEHTRKQLLH